MSDRMQIGGITHVEDLTLISVLAMPSQPGTAGTIMTAMGDNRLNLEFVAQTIGLSGKDHIIFCVKQADANRAIKILEALKLQIQAEKLMRQDDVSLVCAFGPDFRRMPGIAGKVCRALGVAAINIIAISTSTSTISCVITGKRVPDALAALNDIFITPS